MRRSRVILNIVLVAMLAGLAAGCSNLTDAIKNESGFIRGPFAKFSRDDGSSAAVADKNFQLSPTGPVAAEELVQPDGRCAAVAAPVTADASQAAAQPAAQPADRAVGSMAGDLAGAPMPAASAAPVASSPSDSQPGGDPGNAPLLGGVALGMSECETVRRAGLPSNVNIGLGDGGDRKVVLTYLEGNWPGIYTFAAGRLKDISAAPGLPKPVKPVAKKKPTRKIAKPKAAPAAPATKIQ